MKFSTFSRVALGAALAVIPSCNLLCPYLPDQLFETQVRAECHFYFACCTAGEADIARAAGLGNLANFRDEGHCVQERLEEGNAFNEIARLIQQGEAAGRLRYDYGIAERCNKDLIDAMNSCDADKVLGDGLADVEVDEECVGFPGEGLVKDGGNCYIDFECEIPGSKCLSPNVLLGIDDLCANDGDCGNNEVCTDNVCVDKDTIVLHDEKVCIRPIKKGEDCTLDPDFPALAPFCEPGTIALIDGADCTCEDPRKENDDCNASAECETGLFCDAGTCEKLKGQGDECNASAECERRLLCDTSLDTPTCQPPPAIDVQICDGIQGTDDVNYDP